MNRNPIVSRLLALCCCLGACTESVFLDDEAASSAAGARLRDGGADDELPTRFTGNASTCPATAPMHDTACETPEGESCAYFADDPEIPAQSFYSECACRTSCDANLSRRWDCYRNISVRRMECPVEQPLEGSSCFGSKGTECYYPPSINCRCPTESGNSSWTCESEVGDYGIEAPPAFADDDARVRDMPDAEREAFCGWLTAPQPGFPSPIESAPDADGFYHPSNGCYGESYLDCGMRLPDGMPASACLDNLGLNTCEATLAELHDCIMTMRTHAVVGRGCGPYFAASGCAGTIVLEGALEQSSECNWRVR